MREYKRRRRSVLEIKVEVLRACFEPNPPTRIMYASNISWVVLRKILPDLLEGGLVEFHENKVSYNRCRDGRVLGLYVITDRGRNVLAQFEGFERDLFG